MYPPTICPRGLIQFTSVKVAPGKLTNTTTGESWTLKPLGEVGPIIEAGGLFPYAEKVGMLPSARK